MKTWVYYKITPTRYRISAVYETGTHNKISDECNIYYGKQPNVGWRFVVENDGFSQVGGGEYMPQKKNCLLICPVMRQRGRKSGKNK